MQTTKRLSEFITSTDFDDLPSEVVNEAKLCFMDWLAVTIAGANEAETRGLVDVIDLVGGKEQATVLGKNIKTSVLNTALLNGMISHVLDFDDTSIEFLGHPSVTLFPGLLALSEWKGKSGKDFLAAFVIGFEAGCRVALGATVNHYLAGWHGTSTIGHFSSTAGCAKLLGLNTQQAIYALGAAGTQAAGIKTVFGTSCKPLHAGKACFDGLLSALLAQRGLTSVENILEGKKCFWDMFSKDWDAKRALEDLGSKWNILGNRYKFHASCYQTHPSIEAALVLKKAHAIDPKRIQEIEIHVLPPVLEMAGKEKPVTALEGKFSIPYSVANALLTEDTGITAFTDEKVNDPDIIALRDKIKIIPDTQIGAFEADVIIYKDGTRYQKKLDILQYVMDEEEKKAKILTKFRSLAGLVLEKSRVEAIIPRLENVEQEGNMADIVKLIA